MSDQVRVRKADAARASFKVPAFRRVWLMVAIGSSGMYGVVLVAGLYAYQLSHSSVLASASYTLILLPTVIVGPLAGGYVDKNDRRRVMRLGMILAVIPLSILSIADATHLTSAYLVLTCCAVVGCGRSLYGAAWQALVPDILPPEDLVSGGSLMQVASQGGEAVGPLIVGVVISLTGTASGFIACLVLYVLALMVTKGMSAVHGESERHLTIQRAGVWEGVVRIAKARPLALWMVFVGLHCSLTMAFMGLLPAFSTQVLHAPNDDSVMFTVIGIGAVLGAGSLAVAPRSVHTGRIAIGSGLMSGLALVMLGLSTSPVLAIAACFFAGGAQAMFMSLLYAMIQGNAPQDLRGRVAGYQNTVTAGSMSVLSTAWGALQHPFGFIATLVIPGLFFAAAVVFFIGRLDLWRDKSGVPIGAPLAGSPTTA